MTMTGRAAAEDGKETELTDRLLFSFTAWPSLSIRADLFCCCSVDIRVTKIWFRPGISVGSLEMPFARAAVTSVFFLLSIYKALVDRANQGVNKEREQMKDMLNHQPSTT
jgi:hypothetical protein